MKMNSTRRNIVEYELPDLDMVMGFGRFNIVSWLMLLLESMVMLIDKRETTISNFASC